MHIYVYKRMQIHVYEECTWEMPMLELILLVKVINSMHI